METTRTFERRPAGAALVLLATLWCPAARADSPLTSCDFHEAYADVPAVAHALEAGLDDETMEALDDPAVPHDVRAAIVNALGWRVDDQAFARRYLGHIAATHGKSEGELKLADLTRLEFHGPAAELDKLRPRCEPLNPAWFVLECGVK